MPKICKFCSMKYSDKRSNFCSKSCSEKLYRLSRKEHYINLNKVWLENNPDKKALYNAKTRDSGRSREYYRKNKETILKQSAAAKKRYHSDSDYRRRRLLRGRLNRILKGRAKGGSAVKDLGCSVEHFKLYIESLFKKDMTWSNHSFEGWHLDHIIPLVSFDLTSREELLKACHCTNLQPLWKSEHLMKTKKENEVRCAQK